MKVEIRQFKFNMLSTRKHNKRWRQSSGDSKAPYRRRGRPRRRLMDEIHEITGTKLAELRDMTTEKKQWRRFAIAVGRVPGTDSTR